MKFELLRQHTKKAKAAARAADKEAKREARRQLTANIWVNGKKKGDENV